MTEPRESHEQFTRRIAAKEARKLKNRREKNRGMWFGLGTMGTVGWSVVVPTLAGALIGRWLDARNEDTVSWTLMLILIGLALGSLNAYHWIFKQDRTIHRREPDD